MRRLFVLAAAGVLGLAMAQGRCPSTSPGVSTPPVISLRVTPEGLAAPGSLTVQANVSAYVTNATLWVRGKLRWEDYGPVLLASWDGSEGLGQVSFGPLEGSANGIYTFSLTATLCYRLNGALKEETQTKEVQVPVYIPWRTSNVAWFLWKEAEASNYIKGLGNDLNGGQPMFIEGLVKGLAEGVRSILRILVRGYLNEGKYPPSCTWFCYSIAPVKLQLYAVQGVEGLFQQGWAQLGFYGGLKDSHSFELGTKGVGGVLVVRGYRHDYILLSAQGDFGDEAQVAEMPKGGAELFRKVLSLSTLQSQAREVQP